MAKARKLTGVEPLHSYRENARTILPQRVEEVWTWEPFIWDAARREELHNMRISVKRLRYTMEIFQGAYQTNCQQSVVSGQKETLVAEQRNFTGENRYLGCLEIIIDLQEILGDVHDCDVVLDALIGYAHRVTEEALGPGIATLIVRTQETRKADYERFLRKWEHLSATNFKQKLLSLLVE